MKQLTIMQPYLFPYIGYFQLIHAVDKVILYDNLPYIKKGWVNRNRLLVKKQKPTFFIAQIKNKNSDLKINEAKLENQSNLKKKILDLLLHNYKYTPFFNEVYPMVESVLNTELSLLTDLNALSINTVCDYLDIRTLISRDHSKFYDLEKKFAYDKSEFQTLFPSLYLKNCDRKHIRVMEMCRIEKADVYINPIGGQAIYDKNVFKANQIDLHFLKTRPCYYKQASNTFFPNLSIIDVLMNCGKKGTKDLLKQYDLV